MKRYYTVFIAYKKISEEIQWERNCYAFCWLLLVTAVFAAGKKTQPHASAQVKL